MARECVFCGTLTDSPEEHHPNRRVDGHTTITLCNACHQTYLKPLAHKVENAGEDIDWQTDGLAYCEIGGCFTNISHKVSVRHGYCMDSPFCWATECEYNTELTLEKENEITAKLYEGFFAAFVDDEEPEDGQEGNMALTDEEGNYWFERDDVINRLISLIDDEDERGRFQAWYESVDTSVGKQQYLDNS